MEDVKGPSVPLRVVAAKRPGKWIIRAWACFVEVEPLQKAILDYVGRLDTDDLIWTTHVYDLPAYVVYEPGNIGWQAGLWMWKHVADDCFSTEPEELAQPGKREPLGALFQMAER